MTDLDFQDLNFRNMVYFYRDELKSIIEGLPVKTLSESEKRKLRKMGILESLWVKSRWKIKDGVLSYRKFHYYWEVTEKAKKILNSLK